jgi:hypothetical protein
MAAASLARGRSDENDAPQVSRIRPHVRKSRSSRVRQTEYEEKQLRRTKPVATCPVSLARLKQDSTHCLGELRLGELRLGELCICKMVCCAASPNDWFRLMLAGLHGI